MSRQLPGQVAQVGRVLAATAGGYLRNTVREEGVTCTVCSRPVENGYQRCYQCKTHVESGVRIADRVASVVYAAKPSASGKLDQTYTAMFGYKADRPRDAHTQVVGSLLALGLAGHLECDVKLSGATNFRWATVPSTQRTGREHPLRELVAKLFRDSGLELVVTTAQGATKSRSLHPESFLVSSAIPASTHVALIDDSWVTGANAQSAAAALKQAGGASVSILTIARVLDPEYPVTAAFLRSRLASADFDYTLCPWTGGACP
jgi:hypothetical protein